MELPPADFDGAWTYALDHYVAPLLELLFPEVWRTVDWQQPVIFRDTELHQLDPDVTRGKHRIDKLVQVQAHDGTRARLATPRPGVWCGSTSPRSNCRP